jgi:hypothetical protein
MLGEARLEQVYHLMRLTYNIVLCLKNSIPIEHLLECYASKKGLTAHNLYVIMMHMTPIEEGCYASNNSAWRSAAEPPAALA